MKEWKTYRLGDIITISSGFPYKGEFIGKGNNYLLGMGCVSFKETFLNSGMRQYSGDAPERYVAHSGDIVLATRQQSDNLPILGMPAIIPQDYNDRKMIIGANLYKVQNESEFSNGYIYWLMKSPAYIHHIKSCQTGTTVRMITKANIEDFTFKAPQKSEREKISSILWNIEEKIALNRQINDNLEQQAQALYKSWFLDFEPFKDGNFVESELGLIPEGWEVRDIYKYTDVIYGAPYKSSLFNENKEGYPLIRIRDLKSFAPQFYTQEILPQTEYIIAGDVVAGMDAEFTPYIWQGEKGVLNQRCCKFKGQYPWVSNYYLLNLLKPELEYVQSYKTGTTVSHLGKADIDRFKVITPPESIVKTFSVIVNSLLEQKIKSAYEIRNLTSTRDSLLPKLMSGELKINEIDC